MDDVDRAEVQEMVTGAIKEAESRLLISLGDTMEGINAKLDGMAGAASEVQATVQSLPNLIQSQVESQLKVNLSGIIAEVGKQFEDKMKAMAGGAVADGGGMSLDKLLTQSDKIVSLVNAFRSPTTEQAMMGQMNFVFRWHKLLSQFEKGGGTPDEIAEQLTKTFTTQKE